MSTASTRILRPLVGEVEKFIEALTQGCARDSCLAALLESVEQSLGPFGPLRRRQPEIGTVKGEDLDGCQGKVEVGPLTDDSNEALDGNLFLPDVMPADPRLVAGWSHPGGQYANGG